MCPVLSRMRRARSASSCRIASGLPRRTSMKSRFASAKVIVSVIAVTVAERGPSSKSEISPNTSPPRCNAITTSCPPSSGTDTFTVPDAIRNTWPAGSSRWKITSFRWKCFARMRAASSSRSRCPRGAKTGECARTSAIWLASTTLGGDPHEPLEARPHVFRESLHGLHVEGMREPDDVAADAHVPVLLEARRDRVGVPDEGVRAVHAGMMLGDLGQHGLGLGLRFTDHEPAAAVRFDLRLVAARVAAVLPEDLDLARHRLRRPEAMPHVRVARRGSQRLLLAAAADHD